MGSLKVLFRQIPRIEDEVRQFFQHNSIDLDKDVIKSIKETVKNILQHALTAKSEIELIKDMTLLDKLLKKYHFDEGLVSKSFSHIKYELEMDFQEVVEVNLQIKKELDSEKPKKRKTEVVEQKLIESNKKAPNQLNEVLKKYNSVKKK